MKNKKSWELSWQFIALLVISLLVALIILFGFPKIAEGFTKAAKFLGSLK